MVCAWAQPHCMQISKAVHTAPPTHRYHSVISALLHASQQLSTKTSIRTLAWLAWPLRACTLAVFGRRGHTLA